MSERPDPSEIERRLWQTLKDTRAGMLGAVPPNHLQPMHVFPEQAERRLYFVTAAETDLVREMDESGTPAHYVVIAKDQSLWATVRGRLRATHDQARIDRYWSPFVAAWYPGKDRTDPSIILLTLDIDEADVWTQEAGPLRFALEIAKANLTDTAPDVGAREKLEMRHEQ